MACNLVDLRRDPIGVLLLSHLHPQQQVVDLRVARGITPLECGVERRELRIYELAVEVEDLANVAPNVELAVSAFGRVPPSCK